MPTRHYWGKGQVGGSSPGWWKGHGKGYKGKDFKGKDSAIYAGYASGKGWSQADDACGWGSWDTWDAAPKWDLPMPVPAGCQGGTKGHSQQPLAPPPYQAHGKQSLDSAAQAAFSGPASTTSVAAVAQAPQSTPTAKIWLPMPIAPGRCRLDVGGNPVPEAPALLGELPVEVPSEQGLAEASIAAVNCSAEPSPLPQQQQQQQQQQLQEQRQKKQPDPLVLDADIIEHLRQDEVFKDGGSEDVDYFTSFLQLLKVRLICDLLQNDGSGSVLQNIPQLLAKYELACGSTPPRAKAALERMLAKATELSHSLSACSVQAQDLSVAPPSAPSEQDQAQAAATLLMQHQYLLQQQLQLQQQQEELQKLTASPAAASQIEAELTELVCVDKEVKDRDREYILSFLVSLGARYVSDLLYDSGTGPLILHLSGLFDKFDHTNGVVNQEGRQACQQFLTKLVHSQEHLERARLQYSMHQQHLLAATQHQQVQQQRPHQGFYEPSPAAKSMWKASNTGDVEIPMHPEVVNLAQHCGLNEVMTKRLNTAMMLRYDTFEADMGALVDAVKVARNPAGLLTAKIKEMQWGTFVGKAKPDEETEALCRKFKLDEQAMNKLTYWLNSRGASRSEDLKMINKQLEYSNKPSAKIMQLLSKLFAGQQIGFPERGPAPGSWADLRLGLKDIRQQQSQKASWGHEGAEADEDRESPPERVIHRAERRYEEAGNPDGKLCRYFTTAAGCRYGSTCVFVHLDGEPVRRQRSRSPGFRRLSQQ